MQRTFDFYSDSGHGWLKVPKGLLSHFSITEKISSFSYQRGNFAYLEEDCDATTFCNAYESRNGCTPKFRFHNTDGRSKIRSYESYRPVVKVLDFRGK